MFLLSCTGRTDVEPFLRFGFRRQPLVMRVNHCGAVARLRRGEVLIGFQCEVKRAKPVSQSVSARWNFQHLPPRSKIFVIPVDAQTPHRSFTGTERVEPFRERRADFHQPPRTCLCFRCLDLNMVRDPPDVFPRQAQRFLQAQACQRPPRR